ncbi:hypothetical protein [Sulfurospirillum arcachonense]|uniref:hypothetical protein n=1 Tax=Sulfurospirillum arcachonense TaxID=57666 RepID=UPI0004AF0ED4|nr:hypothetical protein [Sulfurospirillum arcachonense]
MIGIIAQLDVKNNSAIIIDDNKKRYSFALDACIGFETFPELGEKVKFGLEGEEVFFVEAIVSGGKSFSDEKVIENNIIAPSKKSTVKLHVNIPLDKSIKECLENYFEEVISVVYDHEAEFEEGETLDFLLMKRFLHTAYNNLRDMDSTFMDDYVLELRADLKALETVYQNFHNKNRVPEVAYETIFLEQQSVYQNYKKRMQSNISELYTLKASIKSLEHQIEDTKKAIKNSKVPKLTEMKINELKKYKTYYVDSIHKTGNLRDENIALQSLLENFENQFREEFISLYSKEAKKYDEFIREQLDGYAYEFDKKMWESAEKSSAIRSFFKRSYIEDDFSSKTFLKYFISSLDNTKFSKEHKRLNTLLDYLDSRAKMRTLVVSENPTQSDQVKHLVRSLDKDYSAETTNKPRSTYYRNDISRLDIIFIDQNIKNPPLLEFLGMLEKRLQQSKSNAQICITAKSFSQENLFDLQEKGIKYFLSTNLRSDELQSDMKEIIESIHV